MSASFLDLFLRGGSFIYSPVADHPRLENARAFSSIRSGVPGRSRRPPSSGE